MKTHFGRTEDGGPTSKCLKNVIWW